MPQLSIETFVSQYFWLLVIFFSFLYVSTVYVIPKISKIQKIRNLIGKETTIETTKINTKGTELLKDYKW
jgi:F0F1-type ATP synthase membrane subunit b/b'